MNAKKPKFGPHPHAWLWWLALFILIIGSGLAYILSLDRYDVEAEIWSRKILAFSIVGAGVCVISAMAQWFIKR